MNKKPWDYEAVTWCRNASLLFGEPDRLIRPLRRFNCHHEERLVDTMRDIGGYIYHSYDLFANPLVHLRTSYPRFSWKHLKPKSVPELVSVAASSDYMWLVDPDTDTSMGIVVARYKHRDEARKMFYHPGESLDEIDICWPLEALKEAGCRLITEFGSFP
jgi:hypothetical protein